MGIDQVIYTSKHKKDGALRKKGPCEVSVRWYKVGGKPTLFVFGPARETPFQHLDDDRKREVGAIVREHFEKTIGIRRKTAHS